VARTRNGFTPASREKVFTRFQGLEIAQCLFANLSEAKGGVGLTAEKMKEKLRYADRGTELRDTRFVNRLSPIFGLAIRRNSGTPNRGDRSRGREVLARGSWV
jgi:hypothetical protein